MALEGEMKLRLERALGVVEDYGARGTRLLEDARRLCARIRRLVKMELVAADTDSAPMEICCYALQLPLKSAKGGPTGRTGRTSLKDRCEQAAEMLVGVLGDLGLEATVDAAAQLLAQVHQRHPASDQARLLSDALNLEDFGITGLLVQAVQVARQGGGILQIADGLEKREQYGYWDARLKDGFHFDPVRQLARKRLEHARKTAAILTAELKEDGALG